MRDLIIITFLLAGVICLKFGSRKNVKVLKVTGEVLIALFIVLAAKDFISGFIDGYTGAPLDSENRRAVTWISLI